MYSRRRFIASCGVGLLLGGCRRDPAGAPGLHVSRQLARRVATALREDLAQHLVRWRNAHLGGPTEYLDFALQPAAYCYRLVRGENDVGHIIVSARRDEVPAQECGPMPAPHLRHLNAAKSVALTELVDGETLGPPRFVWPSAGMQYVLFGVLRGGVTVGDVTVYMRSLTVRRDRLFRLAEMADGKGPSRATASRARELWARVEGRTNAPGQHGLRFIRGLPAYACVIAARPTSVAMWLSGLGFSTNTEPVEDVAELMPFMEHTLAGHPGWDVSGGVRRFAEAHGLQASLKLYSRTNRAPTLEFRQYRRLIDAGQAPLLGMFPRYHIGLPVGEELGVPFGIAAVGAGHYEHPTLGSFVIARDAMFLDEQPSADRDGNLASPGTTFYAWRGNTADLAGLTLTTKHSRRV